MINSLIKNYRIKNNISQQEMAERLNVHPKSISNYEKNTSAPQLDVAVRLADLLNISLDELAGRDFNSAENTLTSKEKLLIDVFRQIKDDDKDRAIIILQSMINLDLTKKDITA